MGNNRIEILLELRSLVRPAVVHEERVNVGENGRSFMRDKIVFLCLKKGLISWYKISHVAHSSLGHFVREHTSNLWAIKRGLQGSIFVPASGQFNGAFTTSDSQCCAIRSNGFMLLESHTRHVTMPPTDWCTLKGGSFPSKILVIPRNWYRVHGSLFGEPGLPC